MFFRTLGNTGLRLSAIGLGGHWPTADGRRYEDHFQGDEIPYAVSANRAAVLSACEDRGINYIDITTAAEALAYGCVLTGRRDRFIIGADDYQWSARNASCLNVKQLTANVERCLTRLRTDYLDIWRVTAEVHGRNSDAELATVIETADQLRAAGKIRYLGLSSHHAGWLHHAVVQCPELDMVLMPCLPFGHRHDVLGAANERCLGIVGIKPFIGGLLFATEHDVNSPNGDTLAQLALRWLLHFRPDMTCIVPGMATVDQVRNAAAAADATELNSEELASLQATTSAALLAAPPEYAWLANWARA